MLREVGFVVGGAMLAGTGIAFFVVLFLLGAGWWEFSAYTASLLMVGFGAFFIYVGRSEGADRRRELAKFEKGTAPPPP
jgi:hypothetical protein